MDENLNDRALQKIYCLSQRAENGELVFNWNLLHILNTALGLDNARITKLFKYNIFSDLPKTNMSTLISTLQI